MRRNRPPRYDNPCEHDGSVQLIEAGAHLGGTVADLGKATGTIEINDAGARVTTLTALLGTSPIALTAQVEDFQEPQLKIHLTAPELRADEAIFPSPRAKLYDLDARLVIDRNHVAFTPATVRLGGGTRAEVRGQVDRFAAPRVRLDITAPYADVDEIIALWERDESEEEPPALENKTTVRILASAATGKLGGLRFQEAEAEILSSDHVLLIHPVRFRVDQGYGIGEVVVDHRFGSPSLLKISGHLEDIDAAAIHQDLLQRKSLVSGTLRGDFYLEGRAGKDFLPTSSGAFHLTIRDGVMRKFKVLSKVFSVLNVSQILSFKLPDMATKGMPFKILSGNLTLTRGLLASEDFFIDGPAINLSIVGGMNLIDENLDLTMGLKPLRTVDTIVSYIPLAGWLLTGEEKALLTAHFQITGNPDDPEVLPIPVTSVSKKVLGIFRRILNLPGTLITDPESLVVPK